jgi:hypothetical protein
MNKFSLLLMSLVIVGSVVTGETGAIASAGQVSQAESTEGSSDPKADAKMENPVVENASNSTVTVNQATPVPTLIEGDKESLPGSKLDAIKAFFAHGLIKVQDGASFAKYYLFGDFLTKYLVNKEYIADANKALLTSYVTPKLLVNYVAVVALFNVVYFGYRALASSNQDQDDFMLEDEDEDLD